MLTGHSFSTASQSSLPARRRNTIASSSASNWASKYSPGDAGAKVAGTVRRRLESSVTIMVGLSHQPRGPSIHGLDVPQRYALSTHAGLLLVRLTRPRRSALFERVSGVFSRRTPKDGGSR